jgi:hypothetical protein
MPWQMPRVIPAGKGGVDVITFEDACSDANLYAVWISEELPGDDMAGGIARIMQSAGLVVPAAFARDLALLPAMDLAIFTAANTPFATDDEAWRRHCRRRYVCTVHPSLTAEQRNGARASWGGSR